MQEDGILRSLSSSSEFSDIRHCLVNGLKSKVKAIFEHAVKRDSIS